MIAGVVGVAAGFAIMVISNAPTAPGWAFLLLSPLITFVGLRLHRRLIRRRAVAADLSLCERCMYDLRGLGEVGTCPECGLDFSLDTTRFIWKLWIDEIGRK